MLALQEGIGKLAGREAKGVCVGRKSAGLGGSLFRQRGVCIHGWGLQTWKKRGPPRPPLFRPTVLLLSH